MSAKEWLHVSSGEWQISCNVKYGGTQTKRWAGDFFGFVIADGCPKHVERNLTRKMWRRINAQG